MLLPTAIAISLTHPVPDRLSGRLELSRQLLGRAIRVELSKADFSDRTGRVLKLALGPNRPICSRARRTRIFKESRPFRFLGTNEGQDFRPRVLIGLGGGMVTFGPSTGPSRLSGPPTGYFCSQYDAVLAEVAMHRVNESAELPVRYGCGTDPERIDGDAMARSLFGVVMIGAHSERAPGTRIISSILECSFIWKHPLPRSSFRNRASQ